MAELYPKGRCCLSSECEFEHMELRPTHACPDCKKIVHILCAEFDDDTDKYVCKICFSRRGKVPDPPSIPAPTPKDTTPVTAPAPAPALVIDSAVASVQSKAVKKVKSCPACGSSDHQRRSSKKCPFHRNTSKTSDLGICLPIEKPKTCTKTNTAKNAASNSTLVSENTQNLSEEGKESSLDLDSNAVISEPKYINLIPEETKKFEPVIDIASPDFKPNKTFFKVTAEENGIIKEVIPTPASLTALYWSKTMVNTIKVASNKYRENRLKEEPGLFVWKHEKNSRPFTLSCIYHFLAILYYFGIVRLPYKGDYWSKDPYMPIHPVVLDLDMTRDRFNFIWRHFHITAPDELEEEDDLQDDEDDTLDLVEQTCERVVQYQENEGIFDENKTNEEDNESTSNETEVELTKG